MMYDSFQFVMTMETDGPAKAEKDGQGTADSGRLLSEVVYDRIKDDIRKGTYRPGDTISENQLSEDLDISRTPVREALQKLAQEGVLQNQPGKAVTVAEPSMQEVLDVIHARSVIAPEVARQAAANINEEQLEDLRAAQERMERNVHESREEWCEADTEFHRILRDACPNNLLEEFAHQMKNRIHHLTSGPETSSDRIAECTQEHREVLEAIAERDPDRAEDRMKEHIERLRESTFRKMSHQL